MFYYIIIFKTTITHRIDVCNTPTHGNANVHTHTHTHTHIYYNIIHTLVYAGHSSFK